MLYPFEKMEESTLLYLPKVKTSSSLLYLFLLSGILAAIASLPFIYLDISVKTMGITRPSNERTEVKSVVTGLIDTLYYREGDKVAQHAVILRIKDLTTPGKQALNHFEIAQRESFIHDLLLLTESDSVSPVVIKELYAALYREQANRYLFHKADQEASLKKAAKELELNSRLAAEKVISPKEFFDVQVNWDKIFNTYQAFTREQQSNWQHDLARYRLELSQYRQQGQVVRAEAGYYVIRAPVAGILQGFHTRYAGGLLQANEPICSISPEETLVGECMVPTKDIGLLQKGQKGYYRLEAFNYHYFGMLTGKILSIDNDFTPVDNKPCFKVRCSFDSSQLSLKNGFTGKLKKGLGFQASFLVARRTAWQLLFDKLDNWLNPNAPPADNRPKT